MAWHVYGGPAGEPALGPPAFPHRRVGDAEPGGADLAPLARRHPHLVRRRHRRRVRRRAGGRRPRRSTAASPTRRATDSTSRRSTPWRPASRCGRAPTLALQVSAGRLESAEQEFASGPRYDITRMTASAVYEGRAWAGRAGGHAGLGQQHSNAGNARTPAWLEGSAVADGARRRVRARRDQRQTVARAAHSRAARRHPHRRQDSGRLRRDYLAPRDGLQLGFGGVRFGGARPAVDPAATTAASASALARLRASSGPRRTERTSLCRSSAARRDVLSVGSRPSRHVYSAAQRGHHGALCLRRHRAGRSGRRRSRLERLQVLQRVRRPEQERRPGQADAAACISRASAGGRAPSSAAASRKRSASAGTDGCVRRWSGSRTTSSRRRHGGHRRASAAARRWRCRSPTRSPAR